jgi:hypothetical protein
MPSIGLAIAKVVSNTTIKRSPDEFKAVYAVADPIEIRVTRAYEKSVERLVEQISITELAEALATGDVRRAMRLFSDEKIKDSLEPVGNIISDAVLRGGKVGAEILRDL